MKLYPTCISRLFYMAVHDCIIIYCVLTCQLIDNFNVLLYMYIVFYHNKSMRPSVYEKSRGFVRTVDLKSYPLSCLELQK